MGLQVGYRWVTRRGDEIKMRAKNHLKLVKERPEHLRLGGHRWLGEEAGGGD